MKRSILVNHVLGGLMAAPLFLAADPSSAQGLFDDSKMRGYEYTGAYAQVGAAVGEINFDGPDSDASGGFTLGGGYRFLPWLAADANFTYLGGGDVEGPAGDGEFFAFTFGPKIYPLGLVKSTGIPEFFQPYASIGIGGGEFSVDNTNYDHESSFVARFILGFDLWATDHVGFFVEGGGDAASEDEVDGVGIFTVGGQYRF